jgi:hypothetical protein
MLTPEEIEVTQMAGKLFGAFVALPEMHPSDTQDVCFHVHAIQSIVMGRSAQRQHPEEFYSKPSAPVVPFAISAGRKHTAKCCS